MSPKPQALTDVPEAGRQLAQLMRGKRTLAITGAGMSTDCGLPDYRGKGSTPEPSVEYDMFVSDPVWQRWVWQRNHETWQIMNKIRPAPAHRALADLEAKHLVVGNATQNVDGLDLRAGAQSVYELHGSFRTVDCVDCGRRLDRAQYARLLDALNPNWPTYDTNIAILASANRPKAQASTFRVAPCPECGGLVKPSVVFFGEGLPPAMSEALEAARQVDIALVVGTSLAVTTGMWVLREAAAGGAQVVIINRGPTAGDAWADLRIEAGASQTLQEITRLL